jgi:hypothetical protein
MKRHNLWYFKESLRNYLFQSSQQRNKQGKKERSENWRDGILIKDKKRR